MITQELKTLFTRDLLRLSKEIERFENKHLWEIHGDIKNSGGNLAIHICGNLQHFVGHILGGSDYTRDRPFEFGAKDLTKIFIQEEIKATISIVESTLANLKPEQLVAQYRPEVFGYPMTAEHFLLHLYGHLNYHLGQVNYARRLLG